MTRPKDPSSLSGRVRQAFLDGRTFVGYEPPPGAVPMLIPVLLDDSLHSLRNLISAERRRSRLRCAGLDYDRAFPGDAGFQLSAWPEPDLGCVYVGRRPNATGMPVLQSIKARLNMPVGSSAQVRLRHRSERDTRSWLTTQSDGLWRAFGAKMPTPTFTIRLANPGSVGPATSYADYIITRTGDVPPGAAPPWRVAPAAPVRQALPQRACLAAIAADNKAAREAVRAVREAEKAESMRIEAEMKASRRQARLDARLERQADRDDEARKDRILLIDWAMRQVTTISSPDPQWDWYTPKVLEAFAPVTGERKKRALVRACRACMEAMRQARAAGANPAQATEAGLDAVRALMDEDDQAGDRE